jgi:phosphatidylserine/phosphatidylglycerophosphate/cardiolipin synthase-like enzyme
MVPFINGRYWGGAKPREDQFEAFNAMQEAVEGLKSGHWLLLAAWMFDPSLPLTKTKASGVNALGNRNWGDLFQRKARDGVNIRILMTDFSFIFRDQHEKLYNTFLPTLDKLIAGLPPASRDSLKYVVSLHPATHARVHVATHHQKFMLLKTGEATTAFCGGLDIGFMRTPAYWGKLDATTYRWLWHDIHSRLEGLITNDLEREFVMRWNREKDQSVVASRPGWKPMERLAQSSPTKTDRSATRNAQQLQMLRTVSTQGAGRSIQNIRRDDIWQGYLRLIGCANRFLYMENQYFREPRMADAIVQQAKAQAELVVIIVVPSETDDLPDAGKKHGDSRQHEFFVRMTKGIPASRLRVYTMFHRIIHSKFILADDRALCVGSANANPRGFFLDSELNVMLDDAEAVRAFRHRLWAHNLGVAETAVAGWKSSTSSRTGMRWPRPTRSSEATRRR